MRSLTRFPSFVFRRFFLLSSFLCLEATSPFDVSAQIQWVKYPNNPVLANGGYWEGAWIGTPAVIRRDSLYNMWYGESPDGIVPRTGRATSKDGILWEKDSLNPVLNIGSPSSWDGGGAFVPFVIFVGARYMMWYAGGSATSKQEFGRATSFDGRSWQKDTLNPVLLCGAPGEWDAAFLGSCSVVYDGSKYWAWYTGGSGNNGFPGTSVAIGYATSADGNHWTKYAGNPVLRGGPPGSWDALGVGSGCVLFDSGHFHMWYTGNELKFFTGGLTGIGYAVSSDGIHWRKYPGNPVILNGLPDSWEPQVTEPAVIRDGPMFKMWYNGWRSQIGYATSPLSPARITLSVTSHDFGNVTPGFSSDTAHISIDNWGFAPLVVSSVSQVPPEFSLTGLASLPVTILPFENISIEVVFHPTQPGHVTWDSLLIASNDSLHPLTSIVLRGRGSAPVAAPLNDVAYALLVSNGTMSIDTIDLSRGKALPLNVLSPGPPPDAQGFAVRGFDGRMYGSYSTPSVTRFYRISAQGGDIEYAGSVPLGGVRGIYFTPGDTLILSDSSGRLFGMQSLTSSPFRIDSSGIPIFSFARSPTTGQLWGVSQYGIYKINPSAWAKTLVGTFAGVLYPSIAVGKYGTLYGLFDGNLFEIDRFTGVPTPIGSTGNPNFRALVIQSSVLGLVEGEGPQIPRRFALRQNYPNPFNPSTTIEFDLPSTSHVVLNVYDVLGRVVATLADEELPAGKYSRVFGWTILSSGVYVYRLVAGGWTMSQKMVLAK